MKRLLFIFGITFLTVSCFAKDKNLIKNQDYKLTYEEYINHYGVDDTSIAIINLFFDKRENTGAGQMSFLPLSAVITVITPPIGLGLMALSSPLFVNGFATSKKYSRKNLLKTLINYQNENILSKRNRKIIIRQIEAEQAMQIEYLLEARYNSMK